MTAKHQRDWDAHVPLVLMLGREIRTPAEMVVGGPPDVSLEPPGLEYARKPQDRLDSAHEFATNQLQVAKGRQKRNYDVQARGMCFEAGDLVWVHNPQRDATIYLILWLAILYHLNLFLQNYVLFFLVK